MLQYWKGKLSVTLFGYCVTMVSTEKYRKQKKNLVVLKVGVEQLYRSVKLTLEFRY